MTDTTCDWPLVSILSHELRTPLAVIKAATELLLTQDPALDARSLCLSISQCEGRLEELAGKLLLMFEIETGAARQRFETESARVSLSYCIEAALQLVEAVARERNVALISSLSDQLPVPIIHAEQLSHALACLLDNAVKFSEPGSQVWIRAGAENGHVRIAVEDQGVGIPVDKIPLLFRPFYQVDRHTNEQQGVGLGLYIAKSLVEIHGGDIQVNSATGQGSTFTIVLPLPGDTSKTN